MAFDEKLAARMRARLSSGANITEKRMFGGLAFLLNGNMCCGVHGTEMIVRLHPQQHERALAEPHTRVFDLSGRPMKGWVLVHADGLKDDPRLAGWLELATGYAASLPGKGTAVR